MTETRSTKVGGLLPVVATWAGIQDCWLEIGLDIDSATQCAPLSRERQALVRIRTNRPLDWGTILDDTGLRFGIW
jgi:hypothetical protein